MGVRHNIKGFNLERLAEFLKENKFDLIMIDGPRGVGKTTFCNTLEDLMEVVYYKTWGENQSAIRGEIQKLGLDLPQGTYFVLDFISQVKPSKPVLADRSAVSSMVYQWDQVYGNNKELHKYYGKLMGRSNSVLLALDCPSDIILERRIRRLGEDEQQLHNAGKDYAKKVIDADCSKYVDVLLNLPTVGIHPIEVFDIGDGTTCTCYVSEATMIKSMAGVNDEG